jgi:hypothetical protein
VRADAGRVDINLNDFGIRRVERRYGNWVPSKISVSAFIMVWKPLENRSAGHAHIIGVIVLDVLFAAQGVDNRRFQLTGKFKQLFMRARTAAAAHQGDIAGVTQQLRQFFSSSSAGVTTGCGA